MPTTLRPTATISTDLTDSDALHAAAWAYVYNIGAGATAPVVIPIKELAALAPAEVLSVVLPMLDQAVLDVADVRGTTSANVLREITAEQRNTPEALLLEASILFVTALMALPRDLCRSGGRAPDALTYAASDLHVDVQPVNLTYTAARMTFAALCQIHTPLEALQHASERVSHYCPSPALTGPVLALVG